MLIVGHLQMKIQTLITFAYVVHLMCYRVCWNPQDLGKLKHIAPAIANIKLCSEVIMWVLGLLTIYPINYFHHVTDTSLIK